MQQHETVAKPEERQLKANHTRNHLSECVFKVGKDRISTEGQRPTFVISNRDSIRVDDKHVQKSSLFKDMNLVVNLEDLISEEVLINQISQALQHKKSVIPP